MHHITAEMVLNGIVPPASPVGVGDRVYDRADPRFVGKVHAILRDVALVQWGWQGQISLLGVETLKRVP